MSLLTREAILAAEDRKTEDVSVPEWGGTVRVRALSGSERDTYEGSLVQLSPSGQKKLTLANARAKLVSLAVCDEAGSPLFSEKDVVELGSKSATALQRVWEVASRLSGLSDDDMNELVETFTDVPSGDSTSA